MHLSVPTLFVVLVVRHHARRVVSEVHIVNAHFFLNDLVILLVFPPVAVGTRVDQKVVRLHCGHHVVRLEVVVGHLAARRHRLVSALVRRVLVSPWG